MSIETQKINVILTRICSPTEFWFKIPAVNHREISSPMHSSIDYGKQNTHGEYLRWIKGRTSKS